MISKDILKLWSNEWVTGVRSFISEKLPYVVLPDEPRLGTAEDRLECISSMSQEFNELIEALNKGDLIAIADGGTDAIYTIINTLLRNGIDPTPIFAEVQRSNMDKHPAAPGTNGRKQTDGSPCKPANWKAPLIAEILEAMKLQQPPFKPVVYTSYDPSGSSVAVQYGQLLMDNMSGTTAEETTVAHKKVARKKVARKKVSKKR